MPDGKLTAFRFHGDFDTGAYASWGPTVANRVPVHAMGPYAVPNVLCTTAAIHTNGPPSGAFRGFGVPQAAIAGEALMDMLAERLGLDPLEFRRRNALGVGSTTATGQVLGEGAALPECLDALRPRWQALRAEAAAFNAARAGTLRRGAGIACMWYGIGNTSLSNPSEMVMGITPRRPRDAVLRRGRYRPGVEHHHGADRRRRARRAGGDDAIWLPAIPTCTRDAGKTSASRQTFVSGNAAQLAGVALRARNPAPRQCRAGCDDPAGRWQHQRDRRGITTLLDPATCRRTREGLVLRGEGTIRSADDAAGRRRPGHPLRQLRLRRPGGAGGGGHRTRHRPRACASSRRTMSAARSTRSRSRGRSMAASPRASAWR